MYIAIDGPNFAGKTTAALGLRDFFNGKGQEAVIVNGVRNDTPLGALIHREDRLYKEYPIVNALLIAAEKYDTYHRKIVPLLDSGANVISDRYLLSCVAYSFLYDLDPGFVIDLYKSIPLADLQVYMRTDVETLNARMEKRPQLSFTESAFSREDELAAFNSALELVRSGGHRIVEVSCAAEILELLDR